MTNSGEQKQDPSVVCLAGSVDLEHAPDVRKRLLDAVALGRNVLVDLSGASYIDSSGIACLVEALQKARSKGADLGLVSVSMQAMRVLQLARLDMVFPIHEDIAAANAAGG
ncbi:MAG: STAS domain-containing protein [Alphaproteobacteria bacterium]